MDYCGKSSGLADFENTVDRARVSAVIFDAGSGLCLSYVRNLCPKRDLDHRSFFSLEKVHLNLGVRLLLELHCVFCHQACCLLLILFGRN